MPGSLPPSLVILVSALCCGLLLLPFYRLKTESENAANSPIVTLAKGEETPRNLKTEDSGSPDGVPVAD